MSLRTASQIFIKDERLLRKSKILLETINNKSLSAVRSGRKSCRVNLTVLLSFKEKTDDARACALSGHCPFKSSELKTVSLSRIARENLVNYDDATVYHNDKNPDIS